MSDTSRTEGRPDAAEATDASRVSHDNEVFEDRSKLDLGQPTAADAIPEAADPHLTGEDAYSADEDVDESSAGGLGASKDVRATR